MKPCPILSSLPRRSAKFRVRVHQDIVLNSSMLLDAEETVVLLPGQTRYEQRSGGTSTSTERRIRFTPEIARPSHRRNQTRVGNPRADRPQIDAQRRQAFPFDDTQSIRDEMSRVMPIYQGIEKLNKEGDQLQWGGPFLFKDGFAEHARIIARCLPRSIRPTKSLGNFYLATPRQKVQLHDLRQYRSARGLSNPAPWKLTGRKRMC